MGQHFTHFQCGNDNTDSKAMAAYASRQNISQLAFQGPLSPEMLALWLAFRANLFQMNGPTQHKKLLPIQNSATTIILDRSN